jgi:NAD+ synthase
MTWGNFNACEAMVASSNWIRDWFKENGPDCNAIVGISGGKDSTVVAGLCVNALGKDRVIGVLMPNGLQSDLHEAIEVVQFLDIKGYVINIKEAVKGIIEEMPFALTNQSIVNLPPRIRMSTLYCVSQSNNGRVANTCNLSEDYVGYSTRYGDSVGDFAPISCFTSDEVIEIGRELGLPTHLIEKVPSDGLCGKTDEDNLGFSYATLNRYIRTGVCSDAEIKKKIDDMHEKNKFKLEVMPHFEFY